MKKQRIVVKSSPPSLLLKSDVVAVFADGENRRNCWSVMRRRLAKGGDELVTRCNQLKFVASGGKRCLTDCLPQNEMISRFEGSVGMGWLCG